TNPGPVDGKTIPIRSIRDTAAGPLLDWPTVRGKIYVVEYSSDQGKTWDSAVHRLTGGSTRLLWIDRGQPETYYKPTSKKWRMYRVKEL
ncbi:MAG: hypothetical protein JWO89_127, partial [Verrucomicrobiaceae bacterium]|nr:hypothetical protein [Verrucomicrobiaceae bacterium]